MGTSSTAQRVREYTFTDETTATGTEFDYRAASSESREEAVVAEGIALSLITWAAVAGFAAWFLFWLASALRHVVAQVVR